MKLKLKKLDQQVIVLTGASSGIGLVTARMAARQGARLVLVSRSEQALSTLTTELTASGGQALHVVADVSKEEDNQRIADTAIERFGGFDTWVNNAGISIYGELLNVPVKDMRQLFETNFWGVVYGSLAAARHFEKTGHSGAIINIGSTLSDRALPIQGMYSASKHAVKGFTDALRMELEAENAPISVSLIKPAGIDTPYVQHAKNYLEVQPKNPPPVYAPEVVAEVILHCAVHPERDVFAGAGGKMISAFGHYAPRITDKFMERFFIDQQKTKERTTGPSDRGLYVASGNLDERGGHPGYVSESSLYSRASVRPKLTAALAIGAGLALFSLMNSGSRRRLDLKRTLQVISSTRKPRFG